MIQSIPSRWQQLTEYLSSPDVSKAVDRTAFYARCAAILASPFFASSHIAKLLHRHPVASTAMIGLWVALSLHRSKSAQISTIIPLPLDTLSLTIQFLAPHDLVHLAEVNHFYAQLVQEHLSKGTWYFRDILPCLEKGLKPHNLKPSTRDKVKAIPCSQRFDMVACFRMLPHIRKALATTPLQDYVITVDLEDSCKDARRKKIAHRVAILPEWLLPNSAGSLREQKLMLEQLQAEWPMLSDISTIKALCYLALGGFIVKDPISEKLSLHYEQYGHAVREVQEDCSSRAHLLPAWVIPSVEQPQHAVSTNAK